MQRIMFEPITFDYKLKKRKFEIDFLIHMEVKVIWRNMYNICIQYQIGFAINPLYKMHFYCHFIDLYNINFVLLFIITSISIRINFLIYIIKLLLALNYRFLEFFCSYNVHSYFVKTEINYGIQNTLHTYPLFSFNLKVLTTPNI